MEFHNSFENNFQFCEYRVHQKCSHNLLEYQHLLCESGVRLLQALAYMDQYQPGEQIKSKMSNNKTTLQNKIVFTLWSKISKLKCSH